MFRANGIAGEQATEVDDVQPIVEVVPVGLQAHLHTIRAVDLEPCGRAYSELRTNAATLEIDSADDSRSVLCESIGLLSCELKRKPGAIACSRGDPETPRKLITKTRSDRVALVLGDWEATTGLRYRRACIVA